MTWLTWRQHRAQVAATAALVGGLATLLLLLGRGVHATFRDSGLAACVAARESCDPLSRAFEARYASYQLLMVLVLVCPLLVGLFWGAPLVARELEQGTHRFAWTQGVTRRRWLVTKLAFTTAVVVAASAAYAAVSTWFAEPFAKAFGARMELGVFDLQGVVPLAYTVFAFAAGVATGAVVRRVLPAMGATLVAFVGVRALVAAVVRTRLLPTKVVTYATLAPRPTGGAGDLVVSSRIVTARGELFSGNGDISITPDTVARWCPDLADVAGSAGPGPFPKVGALDQCVARLGLRTIETVHPAHQYWSLQVLESLLFLGLAAALLGVAGWWVLRRPA